MKNKVTLSFLLHQAWTIRERPHSVQAAEIDVSQKYESMKYEKIAISPFNSLIPPDCHALLKSLNQAEPLDQTV